MMNSTLCLSCSHCCLFFFIQFHKFNLEAIFHLFDHEISFRMKTASLNLFRHVFILAVGLLLFENFVRFFFVLAVQWESAEMMLKADACRNKLLIEKTFSFCTKIHENSFRKFKQTEAILTELFL